MRVCSTQGTERVEDAEGVKKWEIGWVVRIVDAEFRSLTTATAPEISEEKLDASR